MIGIEDLSLSVPGKTLFKHFSADIQAGERIGIFGPNGAGKSTFLKALLGLVKPAQGRIHIQQRQLAYLPQEMDPIAADYSVEGFLKAVLRGARWGLPLIGAVGHEIEAALQKVDALNLQHQLFKNLSGGERKRVMLAAILLENPSILLLDEPLANLDPYFQKELLHLIDQLQQRLKLTILITAHDFNPLLPLLDRVMFIGKERAVLDTPAQVINTETLSQLYQTPLEVVELKGRKWVLAGDQQVFLQTEHCHGGACVSV